MKRLGLRLIVLLVLAMVAFFATANVAFADDCVIEGGKYGTMDGGGTACPKHHVISKATLEKTKALPSPGYPQGHAITEATGAAVRMPVDIHQEMPTSGSGADAVAAREKEVSNVETVGLVDAFAAARDRDLAKLRGLLSAGVITQAEYDEYVKAYEQARVALADQLVKVHGYAYSNPIPVPAPSYLVDHLFLPGVNLACACSGGVYGPYDPYKHLDCERSVLGFN